MPPSHPKPFRPPLLNEATELLPDGIVIAEGKQGLIESMNSRAERVTGISLADVKGTPLVEAFPFQDRGGDAWWDIASPWVGLNTRIGHREKLLILPNGNEVLVTSRYLRSRRLGPVVAVVLGIRDAEARRRVEADHAALISTVAHELRSPLTGVKGFSSTLLKRWDRFSDDQKRLMIETIEADADRVTRLITELLDASRIESGRLRIHLQSLDPGQLLAQHVERVVASGVARDRFSIDVEEGVTEVWADPDRLAQIIANLVDNAMRHGKEKVALAACSAQRLGGPGVDITISDDGPGIPESKREIVFSRFWHGHSPGSTGLGLYIVRGLAEAHGGEVTVEEGPMGGALMRVFLPTPPGL